MRHEARELPALNLPDLESLRCFLEAARALNFRAAAATVHLTPAALSKRIQQLERVLGARLFERTTRRVTLTEAGLALIPVAEETLNAAEACVRSARGETGPAPRELTLGTRHELGLSWVLPLLADLERIFPHLTIHLYFSSGPDLELRVRSGEIDCAITSRRTQDPRLDGRRLHREDYVFVGHPKLLGKLPFESSEDALQHTLYDAQRSLPLFEYWRSAPGGRALHFGAVRVMGTIAAIRWSILRKQGVAVLPRYQIQPDLERGRLVQILPEVECQSDDFRLMFRANDPRLSIFEGLAEELRAHPLR